MTPRIITSLLVASVLATSVTIARAETVTIDPQMIQGINAILGNPLGLPTAVPVQQPQAAPVAQEKTPNVETAAQTDDATDAVASTNEASQETASTTNLPTAEELAQQVETLKTHENELLAQQLTFLNRRKAAIAAQMANLEAEAQLLTSEIQAVETRQANLTPAAQ